MTFHSSQHRFWLVAISVALISFSVLSFEIVLIRIFSVMLTYHYVFAIVSFALFGLGVGGMFLKKWRGVLPGVKSSTHAYLFAISITASVIAIMTLPIFESRTLVNARVWLYIIIVTVPFFFAGLTLAEIFQQFSERSSLLYGFDLLGATSGALAVVFLLNQLGGVAAPFIIALFAVIGASFLAFSEGKIAIFQIVVSAVVTATSLIALSGGLLERIPIALDFNKDMYRMLKNPKEEAEIVETRWSAFGRTDLVRSPLKPEEMMLYVDATAGTIMYNLDSLLSDSHSRNHFLHHFGEFFPFFFLKENEKDNALIIGPGGGKDVIVALLGGVKSITAVEVNPDIVQIVKDYENFNGGIYSKFPNVRVVVQEGRNYLRSRNTKYDLIMLALPITKTSRSVEGYALTENYLFTVEALHDYLDHLTPEGRIVIVGHVDVEIYRLIVLALTAFKQRNIEEPEAMKHIYTLASGMMPTIVIKNQPFDSLASIKRHEMIHRLGYDQGNFFVPYVRQFTLRPFERLGIDGEWHMFDQILIDISEGKLTLEQLVNSASVDIQPVTDDSPFFYKFKPGLPEPFGLFSVLIFIIFGLLIVPIIKKPEFNEKKNSILTHFSHFPRLRIFLLIFFLSGMGFMLIEIALFQKLTLYIGQPVLTLTVLLFSLLLGSGLGSLSSTFLRERLEIALGFVCFIILILTVIYVRYLSIFFNVGPYPRIITTALLIPLGFMMGFPFPLSIRLMKMNRLETYVAWMWGVNGIASVVGSALTMIIGILLGFSYALYIAAGLYGLVASLALTLNRFQNTQVTEQIMAIEKS